MALAKTLAGRHALRERSASLNMRERQLLVMCDGKRKSEELLAFVGKDAETNINRLLELGFIAHVDTDAVRKKKADLSKSGTYSILDDGISKKYERTSSALEWLVNEGEEEAQRQKALETPAKTASKRSLAGAKMYVINVLQIVRHLEASMIVTQIHSSQDRDELVDNLLFALTFIQETSGEEYAERVFDQLHNILPEVYLARLHSHNVAPTTPHELVNERKM